MRAATPNASTRSIARLERCIRPKRESRVVPPRHANISTSTTNYKPLIAARLMSIALTSAAFLNLLDMKEEEKKMRPTSKKVTASAVRLLTFAVFGMTAPAVYADEYCIRGGSNSVNGCGYATMEQCQAASSGRGGICGPAANASAASSAAKPAPLAQLPRNSLAYQPTQPRSRSERRSNVKNPPGIDWLR